MKRRTFLETNVLAAFGLALAPFTDDQQAYFRYLVAFLRDNERGIKMR